MSPSETDSPAARLTEAEKQIRLAREQLEAETVDIRQVDLWECRECSIPNINVVGERECAHCGGDLDYLGEADYRNLTLGGGDSA